MNIVISLTEYNPSAKQKYIVLIFYVYRPMLRVKETMQLFQYKKKKENEPIGYVGEDDEGPALPKPGHQTDSKYMPIHIRRQLTFQHHTLYFQVYVLYAYKTSGYRFDL